MLKCGASVCAKDSGGCTPLHWACINGNLRHARAICENDDFADVQMALRTENHNGQTPAQLALLHMGRQSQDAIRMHKLLNEWSAKKQEKVKAIVRRSDMLSSPRGPRRGGSRHMKSDEEEVAELRFKFGIGSFARTTAATSAFASRLKQQRATRKNLRSAPVDPTIEEHNVMLGSGAQRRAQRMVVDLEPASFITKKKGDRAPRVTPDGRGCKWHSRDCRCDYCNLQRGMREFQELKAVRERAETPICGQRGSQLQMYSS